MTPPDAVDPHAIGAELARSAARHLQDACLGGGVHRLAWLHDQRANRREQDDAATALRGHDAPRGTQHLEVPYDVEVEDARNLLILIIEDLFSNVDARRADHDVEAAVPLADFLEAALDCGRIANIDRASLAFVPVSGRLLRHPLGRVLLDVQAHHIRALPRGADRHGFPDA